MEMSTFYLSNLTTAALLKFIADLLLDQLESSC